MGSPRPWRSVRRTVRAVRPAPSAVRTHWPLSIRPISTALARTPSTASSFERAFISAMPAARVTELGSLDPPGALAAMASVKRIEPRASRSSGRARRVRRTAAISFSWKSDSHVASSMDSIGPPEARPALWTTRRSGPSALTAASTKASRSSGRVTSACRARTSPPISLRCGLGGPHPVRDRARRPPPMRPRRASRLAKARPSPSVPPVMSTALPVRSRSMVTPPSSPSTPPSRKASASA